MTHTDYFVKRGYIFGVAYLLESNKPVYARCFANFQQALDFEKQKSLKLGFKLCNKRYIDRHFSAEYSISLLRGAGVKVNNLQKYLHAPKNPIFGDRKGKGDL